MCISCPTEHELKSLPRWALMHLAARSAERAKPFLRGVIPDPKSNLFDHFMQMHRDHYESVNLAIGIALDAAIRGTPFLNDAISDRLNKAVAFYHMIGLGDQLQPADEDANTLAAASASAAQAAWHCYEAAKKIDCDLSKHFATGAVIHSYLVPGQGFEPYIQWSTSDGIAEDLDILRNKALIANWSDKTAMGYNALELFQEFDIHEPITSPILVATSRVNEALLLKLNDNPEDLFNLSPREFEEVVAQIFSGFGYAVELTAQTRDGGCDIIAIASREFGYAKYLIECKRYRPDRKVGVDVIRSLRGVTTLNNATKGILATTATLSKPAKILLRENRFVLEARDYVGLKDWLEKYAQLRSSRYR